MTPEKKARLEAAGFTVGTAAEFLGLTPEEEQYVEFRVALSRAVRERRIAANITQDALAAKIGSSQSRIAKVEKGDPAVSTDLLLKALFATGATVTDALRGHNGVSGHAPARTRGRRKSLAAGHPALLHTRRHKPLIPA